MQSKDRSSSSHKDVDIRDYFQFRELEKEVQKRIK